MQREVFAKALRIGRNFALKIGDNPAEVEGTTWPMRLKFHANWLSSARRPSEFRFGMTLSRSFAVWEGWSNGSGVAKVHRMRQTVERLRMPLGR
jgi:hypothetical protein